MKKWKKAVITLTALLLVVAIFAVDGLLNRPVKYNPDDYTKYSEAEISPIYEGDRISGEDAFLQVGAVNGWKLMLNSAKQLFSVENSDRSISWNSFIEPKADESSEALLYNLFNIVVSNTETVNTSAIDPSKEAADINYLPLRNGFAAEYYFTEYELGITLEVWLDENGLNARVPKDKINEAGKYNVVNLDLLPFFGATSRSEKGYILFPDGIGALYNFSEDNVGIASPITLDVYGSRNVDVEQYMLNKEQGIHGCMLGAFGVKSEQGAFVAYISQGDASAAVTLAPSGYIHKLNRVYGCSVYRRVTAKTGEAGFDVFEVESESRGNDFAVTYMFSENADADYSWMAETLRAFMIDKELMSEKSEERKTAHIELLMGASKEHMLGSSYVALTTDKEAQEIMNNLNAVDGKIAYSLVGWQKEGYGSSPSTVKAASKIGGASGIKNIGSDTQSVFLNISTVFGNTESTGVRQRKDGIVNKNNVTIVDSEETQYIVNPNTQYKLLEKNIKKWSSLGNKSVRLSGVGEMLFDDYNKYSNVTRNDVKNIFSAMMSLASADRELMVDGGNAYTFKYADMLFDLPMGASGYSIISETVPFYYLVINGSFSYSLDTAGNQSSDFQRTKMKWIEYGATPYFMVMMEENEALINTSAEALFSTSYNDNRKRIEETVEEFSALYETIGTQRIVKHTKLAEEVYAIGYDGGITIVLNYTDTAFDYNGAAIEPCSYLVSK